MSVFDECVTSACRTCEDSVHRSSRYIVEQTSLLLLCSTLRSIQRRLIHRPGSFQLGYGFQLCCFMRLCSNCFADQIARLRYEPNTPQFIHNHKFRIICRDVWLAKRDGWPLCIPDASLTLGPQSQVRMLLCRGTHTSHPCAKSMTCLGPSPR